MTTILEHLPYLPQSHLPLGLPLPGKQVAVPGGQSINIKEYQIVAWASLAYQGDRYLSLSAPRFPVLLDTGNSFNFTIQEAHLRHWASWPGFDPLALKILRTITLDVGGAKNPNLNVLPCNLWIHRNLAYYRDQWLDAPVCLHLDGIAYFPLGGLPTHHGTLQGPRLPVVGLRAFRLNKLKLILDAATNLIDLSAP